MATKKFSLKDPIIGGLTSSKPSPSSQLQKAVKDNIAILPELEFFIRKLNESEFNLLKADIEKNGCKEPLKLWQRKEDFVLVDGHHRFQICKELGVEFKVEALDFSSLEDVKVYMAKLQLGRRNLTNQEISYLRGMQYTLLKKSQGGSNQTTHGKTQDILGQEYGVSGRTIITDFHIFNGVEKLPVEEKQEYLQGDSFLRKQDLTFIGKEEELKIELFLQLRKDGKSITEIQKLLEGNKEEKTVKKAKPSYFDNFSSRFEKEIKKANPQKKQDYKTKLLHLLSLLDE